MATEYANLVLKVDSSEAVRADRALDNLEGASKKVDRQNTRTSNSSKILARSLGLVATAASVRQIVSYADAWTNVENRLKLVTDGTYELTRAQQDLFAIAQDTRQSFESTANLYQRIASNAENLGISYEDLLGITKTVNEAMAVSGATAQESAAAIIQLGQAIGSGELRGDEFRSIAEQAPRLRDALVDGLGVDGVGALRELAEAGELTSERVIAALQSQAGVIESEFGDMDATVGQAATALKNSVTQMVGSLDDLLRATESATAGFTALADIMDSVSALAQTFNDESADTSDRLLAIDAVLIRLASNNPQLLSLYNTWSLFTNRVDESDGALERLQAFERAMNGIATNPLVSDSGFRFFDYKGEGSSAGSDPLDLSGLGAASAADLRISTRDRESELQDQELVDAKDHAAKMQEVQDDILQNKLDGYSVLTDAASAYFDGLEGKEAAYARAALSIGEQMLTEQGRQKLSSLWANTYDAAMGAYSALAAIPIIGPGLGAAAFAGVVATGTAAAGQMLTGGRELGGQMLPGNSYIVGERGPEVVKMGSSAGFVSQTPQGQQASQPPQEIVINQNIQANDSKDVRRMLSEEKDFLAGLINQVMNDRGMALA